MSKTATTVVALLLMAACTTVPRTSTELERAEISTMITTVQTALIVMQANGTIEPEEFKLASEQLAQIRQEVAASEHTAVGWGDIVLRVANLAAQWAVGAPPPEVVK